MARLIDANVAIERAKNSDKIVGTSIWGTGEVVEFLEDCPTVDAVPVVRCRDCAKLGLFTCPICFIENKTLQFVNISPDFFCGEGERKEGDVNG